MVFIYFFICLRAEEGNFRRVTKNKTRVYALTHAHTPARAYIYINVFIRVYIIIIFAVRVCAFVSKQTRKAAVVEGSLNGNQYKSGIEEALFPVFLLCGP